MTDCRRARDGFLDLLRDGLKADERKQVEAHLRTCAECGPELGAVQATWEALREPVEVAPPAEVRALVLARARTAVEAKEGLATALLRSVPDVALPIGLGMGVAAFVLAGLALRGGLAPVASGVLLGKGLLFGAVLALVVGGVLNGRTSPVVRSVFLGGAGALGGYLALTLLSPIPASVEFCRVTLLGDPALSVHQLCVIYLGVAALYAGLPMAISAYLWPGKASGARAGLLAAGVFLVLAFPTLLLQVGVQEWLIGAVLLVGAALGSLLGGAGGGWLGSRRHAFGA